MKDERIDVYIQESADFAIPILQQLRGLIHTAIPDIEETIKWQMPSFELNGKIVCSIAGYKKHCVLRFWQGSLLDDPQGILLQVGKTDMRHIGNITSLEDLPDEQILLAYLKNARAESLAARN